MKPMFRPENPICCVLDKNSIQSALRFFVVSLFDMNYIPSVPIALLTICGVCCVVYLCEVAFEPERADEYTLSVRKNIRQIPNMPKNIAPFSILTFTEMASNYRAGHHNRLVNCQVKQNLDQFLQGTFCYLFDSGKFLSNFSTISSKEWATNGICSDLNEYHDTKSLFKKMKPDHKTLFVTRDPFERFANWYLETCENNTSCFGCENVLCTVEKLHETILNASRAYKSVGYTDFEKVPLAPQTWNCDLWKRGRDYTFVKYGEGDSSHTVAFKTILKSFGTMGVQNDHLNLIQESFSEERRMESKSRNCIEEMKKTLFSSQKHLNLFVNSYYSDYVVFDYLIPNN